MKITLGLLIVHEGKNIEKYSEVSGGMHEKRNLCVQKKYKRNAAKRIPCLCNNNGAYCNCNPWNQNVIDFISTVCTMRNTSNE